MTSPRTDLVQPFPLDIAQRDLDDLHDRLDRTRWPDDLPDTGWAYGVPARYLRELAQHWRHSYDWRAAEAELNAWPQFTTVIDGSTVHFAHVRSPEPDATPLIITHGWPGSIVEFLDVVGPLTDPAAHGGDPADAFHVVVPSIPGFGLSGPPADTGWEAGRIAGAWAELMTRLGYDRFGAQGGDWGAAISRELGRAHPERVIGVHLNLLPGAQATQEPTEEELATLGPADRERALESWRRWSEWSREGTGYAVLHSTRPQTLAYALTDSPVGQLAWIVEKFQAWTDSAELPEEAVDRDRLLTNVMLYWLTGTAGSAARIYYERAHATGDRAARPTEPSTVPTALALFPAEIQVPLRHKAERTENIVRWTELGRGGHFAAMEEPDLLVDDVRAFFRQLRDKG
ncbi:epoxide hydrolase family protein [Streptomyces griseorubiginosus]|uniref:epoxide hydrolase family protein n=1 Tax=Streptomyces griseorubiginosus TaxID=67304 RepID=UPI002E81E3C2|nr:epoxide hydrolase family protein [Streptomyces griseorubiginosus]WUB49309.1 epoxide hydrolase [Streptomyces griseorubiginosus]WUB57837.1 epoxide hydrolase [Streptomyces griseorubiginosus]